MELTDPYDSTTTVEKNRGRIETRTTEAYTVRELSEYSLINNKMWNNWNLYIKSLLKVTKTVEYFDHKRNCWQTTQEQHLYVATYVGIAEEFARHIRMHWLCENSNHYVRDQTLQEDYSKIKFNAAALAILRSFTLNILRFNKETNIRTALYRNCCSLKRIFKYVGLF